MRSIKSLVLLASLFVGFALTGCASVQKAPATEDAAAKKFMANPAMSQIYVYRNETLGAALSMPVTLNGKLVGTTGPKSFLKLEVPAGEHVLTSQGNKSELKLTTEKGKIYYVWQEVKMGMMSGGSKLQLVDESKGQKGVQACKLLQTSL